jgi:hypothetical protein
MAFERDVPPWPVEPLPTIQTTEREEILVRANARFQAERAKDLNAVIAQKLENLERYDVLAMDRLVAILSWGRSGSLLLSSYLDGHEDVITLPELCGWKLYEFFDRYQALPLHDKLLAYPEYDRFLITFFEGPFAISPMNYFAAVHAILAFYDKWPANFRESRRGFFLLTHIAYDLALDRSPAASSRPFIVYAQHLENSVTAKYLVEDFPQTKFVHAIRDPITTCDRTFQYFFGTLPDKNILLPYSVLDSLTRDDRPQPGMESRTQAVRLEDLHRDPAETIRDLSDWLGLRYRATLLESTFNGIPYVVTSDGKAWSGRRLEQVHRHSRYLSVKDRALLYALFYENFVDWRYPYPRSFRHRLIRWIALASLFPFPMKTEMVGAHAVWKRRILPSVRERNILRAIKSLGAIGLCRLKIIRLLLSVFLRRWAHPPTLLKVDDKRPPLELRFAGADATARGETKCAGS